MSRKRGRRTHQRISFNPMAMVMSQAAVMSTDQRDELMAPFRHAFAVLASGHGERSTWSTMADMCNLAEALAELQIGSNLVDQIQQAHTALAALMGRVQQGGGWTLHGPEISALHECLVIYGAQIKLCSGGEHRTAEELVRRRLSAAFRAGPGRHGRQLIHAHPEDTAPTGQKGSACSAG